MPLLVPLLAIALVAIPSVCWFARSRARLNAWATFNGFTLLTAERRFWRRGPFWNTGRGQDVYFVVARDREGRTGNAYVRVGHWLFGLKHRKVAVRWIDNPNLLTTSPAAQ